MADLKETIMVALERAEGMGITGGISEVLRTFDEAGLAIVPREATSEMCEAGGRYPERPVAGYIAGVWDAMIAAAEKPRG